MHKHILRTLAAVALSLPIASCSNSAGTAPAGEGGPGRGGRGAGGPVPVLTARVERKPMPVTLPAVGTVESFVTVQIRSQVTGQLSTIHFSEGQEVKKGDPLFTLDQRPFRAALQQAEAVLARDTATYKNAQLQASRAQNLFERGLIPRDQFDTRNRRRRARRDDRGRQGRDRDSPGQPPVHRDQGAPWTAGPAR